MWFYKPQVYHRTLLDTVLVTCLEGRGGEGEETEHFWFLQVFRAHSTKQKLLREFGAEMITVATANTHSYRKGMTSSMPLSITTYCIACEITICYIFTYTVKMTLCEYVERYMKPQTLDSLGNGNHLLYSCQSAIKTGCEGKMAKVGTQSRGQ